MLELVSASALLTRTGLLIQELVLDHAPLVLLIPPHLPDPLPNMSAGARPTFMEVAKVHALPVLTWVSLMLKHLHLP